MLKRNERGFTLIELIIVIAIIGVLAGITVLLVGNQIGGSKERAYASDQKLLQTAVGSYWGAVGNAQFGGERQFPIFGRGKNGALDGWGASDTSVALTSPGNPRRGTVGGAPVWVDDGDLDREVSEDNLNAELESLSGTESGWSVLKVTASRTNTDYAVDSRDYFIDMDELVGGDFLEKVPRSASTDNQASGSSGATYSGSYSWYVDTGGRVKSLYFYFPIASNSGYQEAYP